MKFVFNLPNIITLSRIALIPVFIYSFYLPWENKDYLAALLFIILSISDALDGYIARKRNQITEFGKLMDPIADKFLTLSALIMLLGRIDLWMFIVIIFREFLITVLRLLVETDKVIPASILGKLKTISQIVAIIAVILELPFAWWLMLLSVTFTIVSGFQYLLQMIKISKENLVNVPNAITLLRLLLTPFFLVVLTEGYVVLTIILFFVIVASDKLDGISARIRKEITVFGRRFDSFADYFFVTSSYLIAFISGILDVFWAVLLTIPSILILVTRFYYYKKFSTKKSSFIGVAFFGLAYLTIFLFIISFEFLNVMLGLIVCLAFICVLSDLSELFKKSKVGH